MAQRRVEVGEAVRIRHGLHKGKLGVVKDHERREERDLYRRVVKTHLTYLVEIEEIGVRRMCGSYLDLVE